MYTIKSEADYLFGTSALYITVCGMFCRSLNSDLQNIPMKTNERATGILLKMTVVYSAAVPNR
jgi:hypothetical protein